MPTANMQVVKSFPQNGDTSVALNSEIKIQFSESLNKNSIKNSIIFYPFFDRYIETKLIKGNTISIKLDTLLRKNFVHRITLKNSIKNIYGQPLSKGFNLVFSTGKKIYKNKITGKIFDDNFIGAPNINLYLYKKLPKDLDNLFLLKNIKYGFSISGNNGEFEFSNLQKGKYIILGIDDKNKNYQIDENEKIAYASSEITLTDSIIRNVNLSLGTSSNIIALNTVSAIYNNYLIIDIPQKALNKKEISNFLFLQNLDSNSNFKLEIDTLIEFKGKYHIFTKNLPNHKMRIKALIDTSAIKFNSKFDTNRISYDFVYSAFKDTIPPKLLYKTTNKKFSQYSNITFSCTKPLFNIDKSKISLFVINDSLIDSISYRKEIQFSISHSAEQINIIPQLNISKDLDKKIVKLKIMPNAIKDYHKNGNTDTISLSFKFIPQKNNGQIKFFINGESHISNLLLYLLPIKDGHKEIIFIKKPVPPFTIKNINDGIYKIFAVNDIDNNGKQTVGNIFKNKIFSEPILVGSDSLRVRAGWATVDTLKINN